MILLPILVFLLGLIIGSFLNVVILRLNTGRSIASGRSACASCARKLSWYELVPVLSFLGLRGKCRTCRAPISFQYAVVELTTALTFVILYITTVVNGGFALYSYVSFVFLCIIASILIVVTIYDIKHKIIPDTLVYLFIGLSFLSVIYKAFTVPGFLVGEAIVAGPILALPFFLLWYFSGGRWMGFGDVKLMLGIGWLLGLSAGAMALLFSFWIGGIFGMFLLALAKQYSMKSQVPFAPFLIMGTFIAGVWSITLNSFFQIWL
ncbi:MAG: prepilin peptidase [Minisyncoccia bacterium]